MILTGTTAGLYYNCTRIAKCVNFDLQVSREMKDTTKLDSWDRTFLAGLRDTTATALLLYDPEDAPAVALFNSIMLDSTDAECFELEFDNIANLGVTMAAIIKQMSLSVRYGEAQASNVVLQCSGKPTAKFA
jgi:hypothetical protein